MNAETLAQLFHETYERRAPEFGYETRKATALPWEEIPEDNANKRLMIAVAGEVLAVVEKETTAELRDIIRAFDTLVDQEPTWANRDRDEWVVRMGALQRRAKPYITVIGLAEGK